MDGITFREVQDAQQRREYARQEVIAASTAYPVNHEWMNNSARTYADTYAACERIQDAYFADLDRAIEQQKQRAA